MNNKILIIIFSYIVLLVHFSISSAFGQISVEGRGIQPYKSKNISKRPIRLNIDGGQSKSLMFFDTVDNKLIKSYDFASESPYNNFPFEVITRDARGFPYYKIPEQEINYRKEFWLGNARDTFNEGQPTPKYISSDYSVNVGTDQDYAVVGYYLTTFSDNNKIVAWHATFLIFNGSGETTASFTHTPIGAPGYIAVSADGKYLFVSSYQVDGGFPAGKEEEPGIPMIEIFNTTTKDRLYFSLMEEWPEAPVPKVVDENKFLTGCDLLSRGYKVLVLDAEHLLYYEKIFSREKMKTLYRMDKNGIFFKKSDNTLDCERFDTFPKEKMIKK